MKFFYADSLDYVDPKYDFRTYKPSKNRVPQRDEVYAHELLAPEKSYDGVLISRYTFDGKGGQGRYAERHRQRFIRQGAQRFLRFPKDGRFDPENFPIMADCGAFNYRKEEVPPYTTESMIDFYELCGFTHGVSVDHIISDLIDSKDWNRRYEITIHNANELINQYKLGQYRFLPVGVVQGWSPESYRSAVKSLIKMGYTRIALGGLAKADSDTVLAVLEDVRAETGGQVGLHLFGICRLEYYHQYSRAGVHSFDSTSPLYQAMHDESNNYYSSKDGGHYIAVRIPQSSIDKKIKKSILNGETTQEEARSLESACLSALRALGQDGGPSVDETMGLLIAYEKLGLSKKTKVTAKQRRKWSRIRRTLEDRPWEDCPCPVCQSVGVEVIIFRSSNSNKRRGFHNLWFTQTRLQRLRTSNSKEQS